jgi:cytochrome c-type biogenesis protein CcmE
LLKKKKFLIGGIVVVAAIAFLSFTAFAGSNVYYYEVGELVGKGASVLGDTVKVRGLVVDGSVQRQTEGAVMNFTVVDGDAVTRLPVVYQGVVPDTFSEGIEVVVEGSLNQDGVFRAEAIMPKCPSRYTPAATQ